MSSSRKVSSSTHSLPMYRKYKLAKSGMGTKNELFIRGPKGEETFCTSVAMSVLLVFPKQDAQCEGFLRAAEAGGYACDLAFDVSTASALYARKHHNVIIIDTRPRNGFEPKEISSHIKSKFPRDYTVILAVRPQINLNNNESDSPIMPFISAGFSRQYMENTSVCICLNELKCLEFGEVFTQMKLKAAHILLKSYQSNKDSNTEINGKIQILPPKNGLKSHPERKYFDGEPSEVKKMLLLVDRWDFDVIDLERITRKQPLSHLSMKVLQKFHVLDYLRIDVRTLATWVEMIENNYRLSNSYHNSTHAADVLQATAFFLQSDGIRSTFDCCDQTACLLSAIIHDVDHPGRSNSFQVNSGSDLALLYNDLNPLESHHVALAYQLTLHCESGNIFKNLDKNEYKQLRHQVIDMVLATDMTMHSEHLQRFVNLTDSSPPKETKMSNGYVEGPHHAVMDGSEQRMVVKRMLIKCADVSNPARPINLCIEWAKRIANEYCQQTDEEKLLGLPIGMPQFDRRSCNIPELQISFFDGIVQDMFRVWSDYCKLPELMENIDRNYNYWKEHGHLHVLRPASAKS